MEDALLGGQQHQQQRSAVSRPACTECQRRKQKCNREWPCNHCQKRKVANNCRFNSVLDERSPALDLRRQAVRQAPLLPSQPLHHENYAMQGDVGDDDDDEDDDDDDGVVINEANLQKLGYSAAHFLSDATPSTERRPKPSAEQYCRRLADCPQLDHALQVLPPRPYSDALVQHFLNVVNFHYYIIHPQSFVKEYEQWWNDRIQNKALSLPWTSLLLMLCACSAQFPDPDLQEWLEHDLGQTMHKLSEKYHTAGRELYNTIPVGHSHLFTVQQLLHSCHWFKAEARYVDCWHTLTAGIREAQELGIHQESIVPVATESEREIRRRVWCVLTIWDWQIGALLSRSLILDPTECDVQLPNLSLEDYIPSPVLAMKLQADVIWTISRRFGRPANVTDPIAVQEYKGIVERWAANFPQPYTFDNPDKRMDTVCPWITLHRFFLHTMSSSMALDPLRPFLAKPISIESPQVEHVLREEGVRYSLKLMHNLHDFFDFVFPKDAKYHSVLFFIFDVAALLCSAILHDEDCRLPRRAECLRVIETSRNLLGQVYTVIPTAKKPYEMLSRLSKKIEKMKHATTENHIRKRPRVAGIPAVGTIPPDASTSPPIYSMNPGMMQSYMAPHDVPSSEPWIVVNPALHSLFPQYQQPESSVFGPSPPNGISCANGSFVLSTSPNGELDSAPILTTMAFDHDANLNHGHIFAPDEQYQDFTFANITDADLGTLASIWDYGNLNLDYVMPFHGN